LLVCKVNVDHALEKIEWSTLFFFLGLFVLVNGAEKAGLMGLFGNVLAVMADWPPLVAILLVMWVSGIAAAIMNNVSFTAAMVAVIASFLARAPHFHGDRPLQELMWWGLALAVCLGGNGTIVGAAANLVTAGIAEKGGQTISFRCFLVYGIPVTIGTLVAASIYISCRYFLLHSS
jgi:Na+/H+ antiporter NhaD/arsenite permease-like protein